MSNYLLYIFIGITVVLVFLGSFRLVLKLIQRLNPKLWLKLNKLTSPAIADKEFWDRLAQQEQKHKKSKGGNSNLD